MGLIFTVEVDPTPKAVYHHLNDPASAFTLLTEKKLNKEAKKLFASIRLKKHRRKQEHKMCKAKVVINLDSFRKSREGNSVTWWIEALYL